MFGIWIINYTDYNISSVIKGSFQKICLGVCHFKNSI